MKQLQRNVILLLAVVFSFASLPLQATEIEVQYAYGDFYPTGTGSYSYSANYVVLVENLAYTKEVGIWGETAMGWKFLPGTYTRSVSNNRELWTVKASDQVYQFAGRYTAKGSTYWDNNNSNNYALTPTGETKMIGRPKAILGGAHIDDAEDTLNVVVGVKNLGFSKVVGIRYTTDDWATSDDAYAAYARTHMPMGHPGQPDAESWEVSIDLDSASTVEFAIFYTVNGTTYWQNNFGENFSLTR